MCSTLKSWLQSSLEEFPPAWASSWGNDIYGPWADLSLLVETEEPVTQRLRWIDAGEFFMGSHPREYGRYLDEGELRQVQIGNGFWMADTACTNVFWQTLMEVGPRTLPEGKDVTAHHPVEKVSWSMAQEFLRRLVGLLPDVFPSLPTEAEWEYCCRAGTSTPFFFGTTINTQLANYDGRYPYKGATKEEFRGGTVEVKALPANAWGLFQMHGNVWEWCADPWQDLSQYPSPQFVIDPGLLFALDQVASQSLVRRVLRGGSWLNEARYARSAYRYHGTPGLQGHVAGFRFVLRPRIGKEV